MFSWLTVQKFLTLFSRLQGRTSMAEEPATEETDHIVATGSRENQGAWMADVNFQITPSVTHLLEPKLTPKCLSAVLHPLFDHIPKAQLTVHENFGRQSGSNHNTQPVTDCRHPMTQGKHSHCKRENKMDQKEWNQHNTETHQNKSQILLL